MLWKVCKANIKDLSCYNQLRNSAEDVTECLRENREKLDDDCRTFIFGKERIEAAESQVAALQAELAKLDKSLADPLLFAKDPAKGSAVSKKRAEAARKLAAQEKLWLAAQEEYESAMAAN